MIEYIVRVFVYTWFMPYATIGNGDNPYNIIKYLFDAVIPKY